MNRRRRDLPTGTVTFLFTDIEGSTRLLQELGAEEYAAALAEHRAALRAAFVAHDGVEVDTEGDAFFVAFADASEAVAAAADAQAALGDGSIRVRMGLHTGAPHRTAEGYVGEDVHLGARIAAAGHGGQVLLSKRTRDATTRSVEVLDLGEHRVKDFGAPIWLYQLGEDRFPPLKTISNTNLPRPSSSFVGREGELSEVAALLRNGARLLTLTGPGGTGKTRLSLEAAAEVVPDFKSGVFWVGLAAVRDPALVLDAVGQTLGAKDGVVEHIGEREMLLVLDNFEQLVAGASQIADLVEACRNLRVLATSREKLRVRGEVEYAVPPLTEAEAIDLFAQRSGLAADSTIAELCRRLDTLPLAVELAAARTSVLSPAQILERLGKRLDLLKGGRDTEARQQTLRATIEWSYDLLSDAEKELFAQLSVFAGGWTLEAAEEIAGVDIDVLESLVDKNLVRHAGERFGMLETIREFALERLASSDYEHAVRRRHAEHYLGLVEESEVHIAGPEQARWWHLLTQEIGNIRAGLEWSCRGGDAAVALRLTAAMWRYWWQKGQYHEGRQWYESALRIGSQEPDILRARAVYGLANMALGTGESDEAIRLLGECLPAFRQDGDQLRTMFVLTDLGIAYHNVGRDDQAREYFEEGLEFARSVGDARGIGVSLINLMELSIQAGQLDRAVGEAGEALQVLTELGDEQSAGVVLQNLAQTELLRGNLEVAAAHLSRAVTLEQEIDDRYSLVHSLIVAGALAAANGDATEAARILGHVAALCEETGIVVAGSEGRLYEETISRLREGEGSSFEVAMSEGRSFDHETLVKLVLTMLQRARSRSG